VFCFWAAIFVVSNLIEYYAESVLKIRWATLDDERVLIIRFYGLEDGGPLSYRAHRSGLQTIPTSEYPEDVRNFIKFDLRLLDQPAVDSIDNSSSFLDHPMDNPWLTSPFREPTLPSPGLPFWVASGLFR